VLHRFSRTESLVGADGLATLQAARVAVFGLGGVGGHCAEALARAGVGSLVLVDFDEVCLTNLNRQLVALGSTIGQPKVELMAARIADIDPACRVTAVKGFYDAGDRSALDGPLSYVVDAIDSVRQKVDLLATCLERSIPVVSCMGTGNRLDPTRFVVADISETSGDGLARAVRKALRARGVERGLCCVYSTEPPRTPQKTGGDCRTDCCCPSPQGSAGDDRPFHCTMRRQIPGSISFVPSAAGLVLASVVVRDLLGVPLAER